MAKVKCNICKKQIDKKIAIKYLEDGKKLPKYFCCEEHKRDYDEQQLKLFTEEIVKKERAEKNKIIIKKVSSIVGQLTDGKDFVILNKHIKLLDETGITLDDIIDYLDNNNYKLSHQIEKQDIIYVYGRINYLFGIIKQRIKHKNFENEQRIIEVEYDDSETKYERKKKRKPMVDFEFG